MTLANGRLGKGSRSSPREQACCLCRSRKQPTWLVSPGARTRKAIAIGTIDFDPPAMRVVDTSAWIEWLVSSPTGAAVAPAIPLPEDWLVPTIVQLELVKWLTRELGEDVADQVLAFTQTCNLAPLDTTLAVLAADMFC